MITKDMIPQIEAALCIRLMEHQKGFILDTNRFMFYGGRGTGKVTAYIIKLVLSDGPPLVVEGDAWFKERLLDIHTRLKENGLNVRRLATG